MPAFEGYIKLPVNPVSSYIKLFQKKCQNQNMRFCSLVSYYWPKVLKPSVLDLLRFGLEHSTLFIAKTL